MGMEVCDLTQIFLDSRGESKGRPALGWAWGPLPEPRAAPLGLLPRQLSRQPKAGGSSPKGTAPQIPVPDPDLFTLVAGWPEARHPAKEDLDSHPGGPRVSEQ